MVEIRSAFEQEQDQTSSLGTVSTYNTSADWHGLLAIDGGGCTYTVGTMKETHRDLGIQQADIGPLVENLQAATRWKGVSFAAQNRFLAKLSPMKRDVAVR